MTLTVNTANSNPELPLLKLLTHQFENPFRMEFCCGFSFSDENTQLSYQVMSDGDNLSHAPLLASNCDCVIKMPLAHAWYIEKNIADIDFRDEDIISSIEIHGDFKTANFIAKSLLKPSAWIKQRFAETEASHAALGCRHWRSPRVINKPSLFEILLAMRQQQPCILKQLEFTKPHDYWTLESLCQRFGEAIVRNSPVEGMQTMLSFVHQMSQTTVEGVEGFSKCYTEGSRLPDPMKAFFKLPFLYSDDFSEPQLWLGNVNLNQSASSLHRDPLNSFLHQVIGRKHLRLYSSDQAPLLYPMQNYNLYQPCWVDPQQTSSIHPKFKLAQAMEFVLQAGDVLLIPAGWFHEVYAIDSPTFSVSHFWRY
ncbi:hypothetical protein DBZ36_11005 [Alginatibacterium sediminis]|uniref:JmjC domain-containing protein n=1 Tax=Alginatibacterium sediminis TaxID=2164068 RepID=A0A420EAV4_9ALTE|nr:cupin-like domain-containing protein [Alginatibacterium sediminis]RKF17784.1 hypothetical protein DBZ36_11005 [Alginatibacterium sediminis]